jgi:hypothetical protein
LAKKKQHKNWQDNVSEDTAKEYVSFLNSNDYASGYSICLKALRPFPGLSALQKEIIAAVMGDIPCKHGKKEKGGFWDERCPRFFSKMIGESFETIKKNLPYLIENKFLYRVKPYATNKDIPHLHFVHPGFLSLLLSLTNKSSKRALPDSFKKAFNLGAYYPEGTPINKLREDGLAFFGKISSAINTQLENQQGIKDLASSAINTQLTNSSSAINTHKERNIYKENITQPSGVGVGDLNSVKEDIQSIPYFGILRYWNQHTIKMKMPETAQSMSMVNPLMQDIIGTQLTEQQVKTSIYLFHQSRNDESKDHPTLTAYLKRILKKSGQAYEYLFVDNSASKRKEEVQYVDDHEKLQKMKDEHNAINEEIKKYIKVQNDKSLHVDKRIDAENMLLSLTRERSTLRAKVKELCEKMNIPLTTEKVA